MISDLEIVQKISQCGLRLLDSTVAYKTQTFHQQPWKQNLLK